MSESVWKSVRVFAVWIAALFLVVAPVRTLMTLAFEAAQYLLGDVTGAGQSVLGLLSVVIAVLVGSFAVDVQFSGYDGIRSGGYKGLAQLGAVWTTIAAAAVLVAYFYVHTIGSPFGQVGAQPVDQAVPTILLLGLLIASGIVFRRIVGAFQSGLRRNGSGQ